MTSEGCGKCPGPEECPKEPVEKPPNAIVTEVPGDRSRECGLTEEEFRSISVELPPVLPELKNHGMNSSRFGFWCATCSHWKGPRLIVGEPPEVDRFLFAQPDVKGDFETLFVDAALVANTDNRRLKTIAASMQKEAGGPFSLIACYFTPNRRVAWLRSLLRPGGVLRSIAPVTATPGYRGAILRVPEFGSFHQVQRNR